MVRLNITIASEALEAIVDKYKTRTYVEDNEYLDDELGGVSHLAKALKTDLERGITCTEVEDLAERDEVFGSNKKDPFKRTSKHLSNNNRFS